MITVIVHNGNTEITLSLSDGISSGKITTGVNVFDSFDFSILPNCPAYDSINPLLTHIEVDEDGAELFYGRVLIVTPKMANDGLVQKDIVCESRMAYLCDTIQPYVEERQYSGDDTRNGLQEFIDVILENHNNTVEDYKKIYRGNVTLITYETSEGVYKGLNRESTWDAIKSKLLDTFGGEMRIRKTDGILYLDYAESLGTTRSTEIRVTKNMLNAEMSVDPSEVVSRLIPLGAKLTVETYDEEGNPVEKETEERLTIAEVNDDVEYLESETALDLFGIQYKTVVWDDVTDAQNLKTKGINYLTDQNTALATYKISALDLQYLGESIDHFNLFDSYPVVNPYLGFNDTLEIVGKSIDIFQPYNPELTFGSKNVSLNSFNEKFMNEIIEDAKNIISTNTTIIKNDIADVVHNTSTSIQRSADEILIEAQENTVQKSIYDEFSELVRNILQIGPDGTSMIFQTITEEISRVDDAQNTNYSNIIKYIRFKDGNIILGEAENPITLTLENDILSFKQNGVVVAYLSNNRFHVTDGEFESSLRVGKFAFVPRENGNLSFMKVGD